MDCINTRLFGVIVFLFFSTQFAFAQEEKEKNWQLTGYVKSLQTVYVVDAGKGNEDQWLTDNLIHNRLNFKWYLNENFTFKADLRNRILYGESTKFNNTFNPDYSKQLNESSNDVLNLSALIVDKNPVIFHSVIDRLYLEWSKENWEIRLGRQRINWGISTVWNPNDVFNAFSFTDFDYEERPGSDALRVKYYTGYAGSIEVAVKAFEKSDEAVAAAMWKFNKWNYDFQLLAGIVERDLAFGAGWAGNLKNVGFKGEMSYFNSLEEDTEDSFAVTFGLDYSFKNGIFLSGGFLYNSNGQQMGSISQIFNFQLSAKNLYPYETALFTSIGYPINPLLNGNLAIIYSPVSSHPLFLNPGFTYSVKENWDLDLIGQLIFNKEDQRGFFSPIQAIFMRTKFSF